MESKIAQCVIIRQIYESPYGQLVLGSIGDRLCLCDWNIPARRAVIDSRLCRDFSAVMIDGQSDVNKRAAVMLDEYFAGKRRSFEIPLAFKGSELRCKVWHALSEIGYGEVMSYSDIAARVGRQDAVRAVATAIGANPMSIFIPCHRVISKSGHPGNYAGTPEVKIKLLRLEALSK